MVETEEIHDKKVSSVTYPGGGQAGVIVVNLQRLEPYYRTQFFLADLETGELFAFVQQQWRCTWLYCSSQPFSVNQLMNKVGRHGQAMEAELETEQQTPLMDLGRTPGQFKVLPPLPTMDEPEVYVVHPDAMEMNTRKNYVCDRMRAALIYISKYAEIQKMITEIRYRNEDLLIRLRAVFLQVDRIRNQIDQALQWDNAHRRRREMQFLLLPTRFPRPESMGQGDIKVWTNWIHEETEIVMNELKEELAARDDPDDHFNGSANGVFKPLQENFSLPTPVQTPRRQEVTGEPSEPSRKSPRSNQETSPNGAKMEEREGNGQVQGMLCELSEHSLESLDQMRSIRNLHVQQRQNRLRTEVSNQNKAQSGPTNSPTNFSSRT